VAIHVDLIVIRAGMILNFRPYGNPLVNNVALGGDIMMVAGNINFIGVTFFSWNLWRVSQILGSNICILGGSER